MIKNEEIKKLRNTFNNMPLKDILKVINRTFIHHYQIVENYTIKMMIDNIITGFDEIYDLAHKSYIGFYGEEPDDEYLMDFSPARVKILSKTNETKTRLNNFIDRIIEVLTTSLVIANAYDWRTFEKQYKTYGNRFEY